MSAVEKKLSPDDRDLFKAVETNDAAMVRDAIRGGARVNAIGMYGGTPLQRAAALNLPDMVSLLVELKADLNCPDSGDQTPIMVAAMLGNLEAFQKLLEHGADLAPALLSYAVVGGNQDILRVLVQRVDVDKPNMAEGLTPLMNAAWAKVNGPETVRLLLDAGADPKIRSKGFTALMHAAHVGRVDIVQALLQTDAGVNLTSASNESPLMVAARRDDADMAAMLLDAGADTELWNAGGQTAREIARKHESRAVLSLFEYRRLRDHHAEQPSPFVRANARKRL